MADLNFSIKGTSENPTKFIAEARTFKIAIDEPQELGGTNHAANPVELLLASYAGCINVMGHIIAQELGFKLEKLDIEIDGDLNPGRVFGTSLDDRAGFKNINVKLTPKSDANEEILKKWQEIIELRCPINDNLSNVTPIKINVN
jgi:uncharacterized OsmC-like protein